jgi:hypothetical protein
MWDVVLEQLLLEFLEVKSVASLEGDGSGALWKRARGALAGRVDELGREHSPGKVASDDAVVRQESLARSAGIEPATFRLLTPAALPLSVRTLVVGQEPSDGIVGRPPGSLAVPLTPGGASEAVKLA